MYINLNITNRSILIFLLIIPCILTAFTHLWNPIGFPNGPNNDEGIYIRRAMHVLSGQGPQESSLYDHPYFGQLFLGSILALIGYPNSLNPSVGNVHSIEMLYLVPKIFMGILAVTDTFLIYKISECRYNRKVAFIASTMFAVMPITSWMLRRVWLEPIQLPFLLASILFAIYTINIRTKTSNIENNSNNNKKNLLILLSGIFLGLAIFTKIPAFTMIPLVAFIIYQNNSSKSLKTLGLWFIPVILIPLIWPAYAAYHGQFDLWLHDISWQTHRGVQTLFSSLIYDFQLDPVLLLLAAAGLVFVAIKKDVFLLLWTIPFLIFLYVIGFVSWWHFTPIIPAACIAAGRLIEYVSNRIRNRRLQQVLPFIIISGIAIFGLTSTIAILVTTSNNSSYFDAAAFLVRYLYNGNNTGNSQNNDEITIVSNPFYSWIPMDVFHLNHARYVDYYDRKIPLYTKDVLLTVDPPIVDKLLHNQAAKPIQQIYNSNNTKRIALFGGNLHNRYDEVSVYLYEQDAVTMLNNKGLALAQLGMYNQSITYFDKALAINPNDNKALNNKNSTLEALSEIK
jgi:tetratricopeptide (TPR) repeat protein